MGLWFWLVRDPGLNSEMRWLSPKRLGRSTVPICVKSPKNAAYFIQNSHRECLVVVESKNVLIFNTPYLSYSTAATDTSDTIRTTRMHRLSLAKGLD